MNSKDTPKSPANSLNDLFSLPGSSSPWSKNASQSISASKAVIDGVLGLTMSDASSMDSTELPKAGTRLNTPSNDGIDVKVAVSANDQPSSTKNATPRAGSSTDQTPSPVTRPASNAQIRRLKEEIRALEERLAIATDELEETKIDRENLRDYIHDKSQQQLLEQINLGFLRKRIISKAVQISQDRGRARGGDLTAQGDMEQFLRAIASEILSVSDRILTNVPQKDWPSLVNLFIWNPATNSDGEGAEPLEVYDLEEDTGTVHDHGAEEQTRKRRRVENN
ncbi:hypothetical protein D9758_014339 [Tetrapyrgos nigripes]|uniref:Uncharacterized protein n=1 Tax=Tetrapyrgos nigripes TaxID=182062 RepID=A0A8H5FGT1_9AGAR|nr:hypothetical protein D9758_014339 [Tetrapyrgos nigripes]